MLPSPGRPTEQSVNLRHGTTISQDDHRFLSVPSGLIESTWEWLHWIGLEKDISRYRFLIFFFFTLEFEKTSKFWAVSCKNESNLLLVRITVCIESCLPIGWHNLIWWKICQSAALFWFGLRDVGILYSQVVIQRTNSCLSCVFGAWFSGKDRDLSTCKPWSKQVGCWIHFCMKWFRTLNSYQIF